MAERLKPSDPIDRLISDLETGLRIDEHELSGSLLEQPELFYRVSKALALQVSRRDAAKQVVAETEAKVDMEVRRAAQVAEEKITEKQVAAEVLLSSKVQTAVAEHQRLALDVGKLTALKEAFSQRSYVLKDMVALYISNYYGDASNSSTRQVRADAGERAKQAMREERARRR